MKATKQRTIERERLRPQATYEVGYRKPPREHQFKPGESGNKKGRKKGTKNIVTFLQELLHQTIPVTKNGQIRKIPLIEAILLRIMDDALKGNIKTAAWLIDRYKEIQTNDSASSCALAEDDLAIIERFRKNIQSSGGA
jgi:hypothetical protein